jgi:hypothetical protein
MKHFFILKTRVWPLSADTSDTARKGTITILAAFLFIVFSALGMGMFYVSRIYLNISAYKKNTIQLEYASENGIKMEFSLLTEKLAKNPTMTVLSEQELDILRQDTLSGGTQMIQRLAGPKVSLSHSSGWERMRWECRTQWTQDRIELLEEYFRVGWTVRIHSLGRLENFKPAKKSTLDLSMEMQAGHLPLARFSFLIGRQFSPDQKADFIKSNPVEFIPSVQNKLSPQIAFSAEDIIPRNAVSQLEKALNIKLFFPYSLSAPLLRQALGLEISDEPVPEGVYLIQDDLALRGVFVQGDCDEMILAIEDNFQVISFAVNGRVWILKFSLDLNRTHFLSPEEAQVYSQSPVGIIIVNGNIHSLGGGFVDSSGQVVLVGDQEIPCILRGANLTIISPDKITLSTHLIQQGVEWNEGFPYVKNPNSMLNIFATGKDFFDGSQRAGQISVSEDSSAEIKIQASLTASNGGMTIEGEDRTVHIFGSLQTSDYNANSNRLKIQSDERLLHQDDLLANTPKTAKPVLSVVSLRLKDWDEN